MNPTFVLFTCSNHPHHTIYINPAFIRSVVADPREPTCSLLFDCMNDTPTHVKGTPEEVIAALTGTSRSASPGGSLSTKPIDDLIDEIEANFKSRTDTSSQQHPLADMYAALCDRVEAIDPEAAHYMRTDATKLPLFAYGDGLGHAFDWAATPQGYAYWANINRKLSACTQRTSPDNHTDVTCT